MLSEEEGLVWTCTFVAHIQVLVCEGHPKRHRFRQTIVPRLIVIILVLVLDLFARTMMLSFLAALLDALSAAVQRALPTSLLGHLFAGLLVCARNQHLALR